MNKTSNVFHEMYQTSINYAFKVVPHLQLTFNINK